jgi:hypothetical protein
MSVSKLNIRSICGRFSSRALNPLTGESGLALPIVLAVLALGTLITAPFLTHASTNLIGSAEYKQTINETYSAEAGVEHAVWRLTNGGLDSELVAVGDSAPDALLEPVNGIFPTITVTKSAGGSGGGNPGGTITHSIISTLQFDSTGNTPKMVMVSSGIHAVVYRDYTNKIVIKTLAISSGGIITQTIIDSLVVSNTGYNPDLINISPGIYAVVYRGSSNKGYVATMQISSNGTISNFLTDQREFNSSSTYEPRIIHTSGSYYLVVYRGSSNKGYATTLEISTGGTIISTWVSTMVISSTGYEPFAVHVSGNYYAVAYRGSSNKGNLVTIAVNTSGIITQSLISNLVFDNTAGYTPRILNISGNIYAIVYRGASNYGYVVTVTISAGGIISSPAINTFKFDGAAGYEPYIIPVSNNVYAVVYRGASNDGFLKTLEIASDGTINQTAIDTFEFDASNGYEPGIINIEGSIFAIAYRGGTGSIGYVKTIYIASSSTVNTFQIVSTAGNTTITASVIVNNGVSTLTSWSISR